MRIRVPNYEIRKDGVTYLNTRIMRRKDAASLIDEGVFVEKNWSRPRIRGKKVLVIEPHPDDMAMSCPGTVLGYLTEGAELLVLNVFSRQDVRTFPWKMSIGEEELERIRLEESEVAVHDYLESEFVSLRKPLALKRGFNDLKQKIDEPALEQELGLVFYETAKKYDVVIAPLGIGGHPDHLICHKAALQLPGNKLRFYEDMTYSMNRFEFCKKVSELGDFSAEYTDITQFLDDIANLRSIYRSQFDDINRKQFYAVTLLLGRAVADEARYLGTDLKCEYAERVWRPTG